VSAGQYESVALRGLDGRPGGRLAVLRRLGELLAEPFGPRFGTQLSEKDAAEKEVVRLGRVSAVLGREDHLVAGIGQQAPRPGDLGDIEVVVGQRNQDSHSCRFSRLIKPTTRSCLAQHLPSPPCNDRCSSAWVGHGCSCGRAEVQRRR
jgi:hypothetical protein